MVLLVRATTELSAYGRERCASPGAKGEERGGAAGPKNALHAWPSSVSSSHSTLRAPGAASIFCYFRRRQSILLLSRATHEDNREVTLHLRLVRPSSVPPNLFPDLPTLSRRQPSTVLLHVLFARGR